jgi:hypothetical protein
MKKKKTKTKRVKKRVYKKQSALTKAAIKKAERKNKMAKKKREAERRRNIVSNLINRPRMGIGGRGTAMPSDFVVKKKHRKEEVYADG